jgi:hypothetical protein
MRRFGDAHLAACHFPLQKPLDTGPLGEQGAEPATIA